MSWVTKARTENIFGHGCQFGLDLVQISTLFALLISKSAAPAHCGLWTLTYWPESPTVCQINHSAYRIFLHVTVAQGEYRNAESTKRVTVTRSYRIDRNGTVLHLSHPYHSISSIRFPIINIYIPFLDFLCITI